MEKIKRIVFLSLIVSLFIGCASIPKIKIGDPILLVGMWRDAGNVESRSIIHFIDKNYFMVEFYEDRDDVIPYRYSGRYLIKNGHLILTRNGINKVLFLRIHRLTAVEFQYYDGEGSIKTWIKLDPREY